MATISAKMLYWLGLVGGIILMTIYCLFGVSAFVGAALFTLLMCWLWENQPSQQPTMFGKLITTFFKACLWSLLAVVCYGVGCLVDVLFGQSELSSSLVLLTVIKGAIACLIIWQGYDLGKSRGWWSNIVDYTYHASLLLLGYACVESIIHPWVSI